jgi:hypothetical protein
MNKIDMNKIASYGKLEQKDIFIDPESEYEYPCSHKIYIKNNYISTENGLFIHQLYKNNNLNIPDHFLQYDDKYFARLNGDEQPIYEILSVSRGGGKDPYYKKYNKYKQKYLKLKNKL